MALGIKAIREALETRLNTYINAGSRQTTIYAYPPRDPAVPSIAVVSPDGDGYVDYWQTFSASGIAKVEFRLRIYLHARYIDAQVALDDYLSVGSGFTASVLNALMEDPTLAGAAQTCHIQGASAPVFDEETGKWVADVPITVYCRKVAA